MSITLMLLMLSYKEPVHKDMEILPAPQVTCPISLTEYASQFRWWARKDVIARQKSMAEDAYFTKIELRDENRELQQN